MRAARGCTSSHEFADAAVRDEHVQGWRYQLSLFANVVANDVHGDVGALVDAWFAMWSDADEASRTAALAAHRDRRTSACAIGSVRSKVSTS